MGRNKKRKDPSILDKRFIIDVDKGGVVTYRERTAGVHRLRMEGLPVCSVNTEEEAREIQIRFCRRAYQPDVFGRDVFILNEIGEKARRGQPPELELDELPAIGRRFLDFIQDLLEKTEGE